MDVLWTFQGEKLGGFCRCSYRGLYISSICIPAFTSISDRMGYTKTGLMKILFRDCDLSEVLQRRERVVSAGPHFPWPL